MSGAIGGGAKLISDSKSRMLSTKRRLRCEVVKVSIWHHYGQQWRPNHFRIGLRFGWEA